MWAQFDELKPVKNVIIIVFEWMKTSNHPDVFVTSRVSYRETGSMTIFLLPSIVGSVQSSQR